MDDIEKELEAKSIERDTNPEVDLEITEVPLGQGFTGEVLEVLEPPVKKVKKARSEKQIAAFEKARLKRAEGIALRKKEKQDNKELKKELKKTPLATEEPSIEPSIVKEKSVPKPVVNTSPSVAGSNTSREQVIQNHYYYYGVPPPEHNYNEPKKKKKTKRPPTPEPSSSESESESEEEQEHKPQPVQYQPQAPKYKFSYS
jgi:hypothetical protein